MKLYPAISAAIALALASLSAPAFAQEETFEAEGTAGAAVVAPSRVTRIADLRFGAFARPDTASTIRVDLNGNVTATGAVVSGMNVPQPPDGRGPAQFNIEQDGSFFFIAYYPGSVTISNGSDTMAVTNTTARLVRTLTQGRNSEWRLDMGGTLNIDANQTPGSYSGDFVITVVYF